MKTIFLGLTGTQGSGKSVFVEVAKNKQQIPSIRLGDVIIAECQKRKLEVNGNNMAKIASVLRYEGGDYIVAKKALPMIKEALKSKPKALIIDGIRSYSELNYLKEEIGDIKLVAIVASLKVRKQRIEIRKRIDLEQYGDFEVREQRELGFGLGDVITKADYYILNENITKEEFTQEAEKFIEKILKETTS